MTCREFTSKIEGFTLTELCSTTEPELFAHAGDCSTCAAWLQQQHQMAGAMQVLRSSTAARQAPVHVEHAVLRAFRQSSTAEPASLLRSVPQPLAFRFSRYFGWGSYAAAAAALAICIGLGLFLKGSGTTAHSLAQQATKTEQPVQPSVEQPENVAHLPEKQASARNESSLSAAKKADVTPQLTPIQEGSLVQSAQAQGYTPLMLCDPLSCSGDEQVVRMELPATAADGSAGTQMADVIVGDDGLVRAIRIVQQQ